MNRTETILFFVDDDADDHVIFADLVSKEFPGIRVSFFYTGLELLSYLNANNPTIPDAIILDYNMPMMNGMECLSELKKKEVLSAIPVVIYSTSGYPAAVEMALKAGAWKYEVKGDSRETKDLVRSIVAFNSDRH